MLWVVSSHQELSSFQRSPLCRHCTGMRNYTYIGAPCSHGTKNNQHNTNTTHTISKADICSNNKNYGGFETMIVNSLRCWNRAATARAMAADSAAPGCAVAAVAAARAPGTTNPSSSLLQSTPPSLGAPTSTRRSLPCLRVFRRLWRPLQHPRPFLLLPSTKL